MISSRLWQRGQKSAWSSLRLVNAASPLAREGSKTDRSTAALVTRITFSPNEE
jgi:hypothetical protein